MKIYYNSMFIDNYPISGLKLSIQKRDISNGNHNPICNRNFKVSIIILNLLHKNEKITCALYVQVRRRVPIERSCGRLIALQQHYAALHLSLCRLMQRQITRENELHDESGHG